MRAAFRCVSVVLVGSAAVAQARGVWAPQAFDWQAASPESRSVSGKALDDLKSRLAAVRRRIRVYDAPEPWGPWTRAYVTGRWDVGPGESSSFPTKWMSADGRTVHLVFSGEDAFPVRRATVILR